jgi:hypothetical protein
MSRVHAERPTKIVPMSRAGLTRANRALTCLRVNRVVAGHRLLDHLDTIPLPSEASSSSAAISPFLWCDEEGYPILHETLGHKAMFHWLSRLLLDYGDLSF